MSIEAKMTQILLKCLLLIDAIHRRVGNSLVSSGIILFDKSFTNAVAATQSQSFLGFRKLILETGAAT